MTTTEPGGAELVIVICPLPVLPDPLQVEVAPTPLSGPLKVRFMVASSRSCGAHCGQLWRSLISRKIFSGGAWITIDR